MTESNEMPDPGEEIAAAGPEDFILETYQRMKQVSQGFGPSFTSRFRSRRSRKDRDSDIAGSPADERSEESGWSPPPGIARSLSGTGKSRRDPQALRSILDRTALQRHWQIPLSLGTIAAAWPEIVGDAVAQHSAVESLEEHRLQIRTDSTAWAKQLQMLIPQIEKRLDDVVGRGMVTQVIVHGPQRPSWKHGPRSVPGRGPRDTYG